MLAATRRRTPMRSGRRSASRSALAPPWPVAALAVALGTVLLGRMVFPLAHLATLAITCALVTGCIVLMVAPRAGPRRRASSAAALHALSPAEFERRVAHLFTRAGFQARLAGASGDGGVDVRVWRDGRSGVVQCKRYRPDLPVGPAIVRELVGVRAHERADIAWLATTGRLTDGARRLAAAEGIVVLDAAALQAWETSLIWRWPRWWPRRLGSVP